MHFKVVAYHLELLEHSNIALRGLEIRRGKQKYGNIEKQESHEINHVRPKCTDKKHEGEKTHEDQEKSCEIKH